MTNRLGDTMNWSRLMGALAAGLVLCGCGAHSASTTEAKQSPGASAHNAHKTGADHTGDHRNGKSGCTIPAGKATVAVESDSDARPGQRVAIDLNGVRCEPEDPVVARSSAFSGPVRLRCRDGSCRATASLSMTAEPGRHPVSVTVAGRTIARDKIRVVRSRRPSLELNQAEGVARPGAPVWVYFDDLYPGERGTHFTVRSSALPRPVRLTHDVTDFYNPRTFQARPELKPGLADGRYTFELLGPHGRHIMTKRLTVRAPRPGDPDYLGKAYGPALYEPGVGYDSSPHGHSIRVARGGKVGVMWHDVTPDPGEETRLTATSPAFTRVLHLRFDDSKAGDGDDPRFLGTATIRTDIKPGRYPVTVVAHRGHVRKVGYVTVTAG
ncbi:hypothetical protein AB0G35_11935 [Streptomyces sp. NPDC021749]|uniref:hypothetical protein n=1 Tax=Streptomyces sp. NPDC021749 TaxID=3154905 RepID=UPI0033CD2E6F